MQARRGGTGGAAVHGRRRALYPTAHAGNLAAFTVTGTVAAEFVRRYCSKCEYQRRGTLHAHFALPLDN